MSIPHVLRCLFSETSTLVLKHRLVRIDGFERIDGLEIISYVLSFQHFTGRWYRLIETAPSTVEESVAFRVNSHANNRETRQAHVLIVDPCPFKVKETVNAAGT